MMEESPLLILGSRTQHYDACEVERADLRLGNSSDTGLAPSAVAWRNVSFRREKERGSALELYRVER